MSDDATGDDRWYMTCDYNAFPGWWCSRSHNHEGPCALWPRWYNWSSFARRFRKFGSSLCEQMGHSEVCTLNKTVCHWCGKIKTYDDKGEILWLTPGEYSRL